MPPTTHPRHEWNLLTTNRVGVVTGQIDAPANLKYTRVENGACELEFNSIEPHDTNILELYPHKTWIKAYRDNVLRFWGPIIEPMIVTQDGAQVKCKDPWGACNLPSHADYHFFMPEQKVEEIMSNLKTGEGILGYHPFNKFDIAGSTSATFDVKCKPGQRLGEFIESLCTSNPSSGTWFRVDAQDDPDQPAVITFYSAAERVDNKQARFEYGDHTLENVESWEVHHRGLLNKVRVYYKGGYEEVADTDSIDEFGLVEKWFRRPGVDHAATAAKIAASKLRTTPYTVASFSPLPTAPSLFDDFDVGDKCRAYFQMGAPYRLTGRSMYYKADDMIPGRVELTVDDQGIENMDFGEDLIANKHSKHLRRRHHHAHRRHHR